MNSIIKLYISLSIVAFFVSSCSGGKEDDLQAFDEQGVEAGVDSQKISAQNVFNTIPKRSVILDLTTQAKAEYNASLLNNPDDVSNYSLESSKALNLGVYGADLNIASVYDQTQESMLFFKCVNVLAKSLGVSNAFGEDMGDRMTANQDNRDSTLSIISQAFKNADKTLRDNDRPGTSSLLVAGAWIEGLYVSCQTAKETKSEPIVKEIFSQNESLTNLIDLLQSSKLADESNYIVKDLQALKVIIENKKDNLFSLSALTDLDLKITSIRTKIISSK
jgi:hypothetical protein